MLEVGTGSAYSTALLCMLVGDRGNVISLDVDLEIVERAGDPAVARTGPTTPRCTTTTVETYASGALERLVAWASAEERVPRAWLEQVVSGGLMVAPFRDGQVRKLRVTADGDVAEEVALEAGFIPLTAEPVKPWDTKEA